VVGYRVDVEDAVLEELVAGSDVVVDCLDNWRARLRVNELVVRYSKPLVHAGIEGLLRPVNDCCPRGDPVPSLPSP
jgi:molybdopterin/thiamine biosynthesis adenylyltransferase